MNKTCTWIMAFGFLILSSCQNKEKKPLDVVTKKNIDEVITEEPIYAKYGFTKLSDYGFFDGILSNLEPNEQVLPYDLNAPLFSDYASKKRFLYLPKGTQLTYSQESPMIFPIGAVLIKNFFYTSKDIELTSDKIIETRLLIHEKDGWKALPYIWNKMQTEAFLEITGGNINLRLTEHGPLNYSIPSMSQCKSCHDKNGKMMPIGPSARQLNKTFVYDSGEMNQIERMVDMGWLTGSPNLQKLPFMTSYLDKNSNLNERARAYLDVNCAHCHNEHGPAKNSGLNLSYSEQESYKLGINKKPVAAGRGSADLLYNIVPGSPEKSILVHRMIVSDPGTRMPEIGRSLIHKEGVALIKEWISKMQGEPL